MGKATRAIVQRPRVHFDKIDLPASSTESEQASPLMQDETLDAYLANASPFAMNPPVRRAVKPLDTQLVEHCTACFEETIFTQGLCLLSESLVSGLDVNAPAYVPPSRHLALAATIIVHPLLTTRTRNKDNHVGSDAALKYLRRLVETVDVRDSGLRDALHFERLKSTTNNSRAQRFRSRQSEITTTSDDEDLGAGNIRSKYATSASLWANAEDFWAVVGWAFHCSVRHKSRWERWKGWLEFMLDAMHSDLEKTYSMGEDLAETLIAQYLAHVGPGRGDKRRILRAITADGTSNLFPEIWKNETKLPKALDEDVRLAKRSKLDLDNGDYGDYFDDSDDDSSRESGSRRSRSTTAYSSRPKRSGKVLHAALDGEESGDEDLSSDAIQIPNSTAHDFGGSDSIRLRQKNIAVLTRFSRIVTNAGIADSLFMNTEDLFDLLTEFLRPLPLPVFRQFVLPSKPYLTLDLQVSLNENLCNPLLGTNTLIEQMTQHHFEEHFAPKCAISLSISDNAKLSLLVESLLRALWKASLLVGDLANLKKQVEKGIEAREHRIASGSKRKTATKSGHDEEAMKALRSSAERLRALVGVLSS